MIRGAGVMLYRLFRPLLFSIPPERAHQLALSLLDVSAHWRGIAAAPVTHPRDCFGLRFPNPIGLAAGFDKNGQYLPALATLGFGFVEIGTVTPRPQPGQPRQRLFRLPRARALINRMGFNNAGVDGVVANLAKHRFPGIVGVNIGKNRDTPLDGALADYRYCLRRVYPYADYIAINISSPNTPGLRDLQRADALEPMLANLKASQAELATATGRYVPLLVKVAPDLDMSEVADMATRFRDTGVDGVIATNTTVTRPGVAGLPHADETGGLSGRPLLPLATEILGRFHAFLGTNIPLIGVGGIMTAADAAAKCAAGATLLQVYTGLVYQGPSVVRQLLHSIPPSPDARSSLT